MANGRPGRPKGLPKTGGRVKGEPNHLTTDIKKMIEGALQDAGGQKYLKEQAVKNPAAFMGLVGKVLPKDLNVNASASAELIALMMEVAKSREPSDGK